MKDSWIQSLFRGRTGAAVLAVASVLLSTYGVSADDQATFKNLVVEGAQVITGVGAAAMAIVSKVREGMRKG